MKILDTDSIADQDQTQRYKMEIGPRFLETDVPSVVSNMDWSGKGFRHLYNLVAGTPFVMYGHANIPNEIYGVKIQQS